MHRGIEALQLRMVSRVLPPVELHKALYTGSRGADVAGVGDAMRAGLDMTLPLYPAKSEVGLQFMRTTRKHGLRAALKWRRERFEALECKE
jgi:hypothetical protein